MHRAKNRRSPALQYMQKARGTEPMPRRKAGSCYDRADGCADDRGKGCTGLAAGTAGRAAPGGAQAGGGGGGFCRRLGGAVRGADALWPGVCAGLRRGLLRGLCGGCGAGDTAARLRGTVAPQHLPAVRAGSRRGRALDGSKKACPRCAGRMRNTDGRGTVLCAGRERRRAGVLRCGRCHAGGGHWAVPAAVRTEKAGCRDAACGNSRGGGARQCGPVEVLAWGCAVCRGGTGAVLQGTGQVCPFRLRRSGRRAVRSRPSIGSGGSRPDLCNSGGSGTGSRAAHRNGGGVCRRLRHRGALRAAARECVPVSAQRLRGAGGGLGPAAGAAGSGAGGKEARRSARAAAVPRGGNPAGTGGAEPFVAGGDGERCLRNASAPQRRFPVGHQQHT